MTAKAQRAPRIQISLTFTTATRARIRALRQRTTLSKVIEQALLEMMNKPCE